MPAQWAIYNLLHWVHAIQSVFSGLWMCNHLFCKSSTSRLRSSKDVSISYFHGATLWQSNLPSWDDRLLFRVAMNAYRGRLHIWRHFNIFFKLLGWRRCSPRVLQPNIHRTSQRQLRLYNLLGHLNWVLQSFGLTCGVRYLLKTELQSQTNAADAGNFDSCTSLLSKETWAGADKNENNKTCTINGRHSHNERHFVDSSLYFKSSTSVTNMRTWPSTNPHSFIFWRTLKQRRMKDVEDTGAAAFGIGRFFFGAVPDGFIGLFPLLTFCAAQLQNIADMMTCYENNIRLYLNIIIYNIWLWYMCQYAIHMRVYRERERMTYLISNI